MFKKGDIVVILGGDFKGSLAELQFKRGDQWAARRIYEMHLHDKRLKKRGVWMYINERRYYRTWQII